MIVVKEFVLVDVVLVVIVKKLVAMVELVGRRD